MEPNTISRPRGAIVATIVAVSFGFLTVLSGGSILLVDGSARSAAGDYVPFVLWFNFAAGFAYMLAGAGLFLWRHWAVTLSMLIAVATLIVFAAFGVHILSGGAYEPRTVGAMVLRCAVWVTIALFVRGAWKNG